MLAKRCSEMISVFFLFARSKGFILSYEDIDPDEMKINRAICSHP